MFPWIAWPLLARNFPPLTPIGVSQFVSLNLPLFSLHVRTHSNQILYSSLITEKIRIFKLLIHLLIYTSPSADWLFHFQIAQSLWPLFGYRENAGNRREREKKSNKHLKIRLLLNYLDPPENVENVSTTEIINQTMMLTSLRFFGGEITN